MIGVFEAARVAAVLLVPDEVRHVLVQRPAERNVEQLHPATDAEHGHVALERASDERDLRLIPFRHRALRLRVRLGPVRGRVDVGATREDQSVEPVEHLVRVSHEYRVRRDHHHEATAALDRRDVAPRQEGGTLIPHAPPRELEARADSDCRTNLVHAFSD